MRAIEVVLSDDRTVTVRPIKTHEMSMFLRGLPALQKINSFFSALSTVVETGLEAPIPEVSDRDLEPIFPLLAAVADIPEVDLRELEMWDGLAIFQAMNSLAPRNFLATTPSSSTPMEPVSEIESPVGPTS